MIGITTEQVVECLRENPGISAAKCFEIIIRKHVRDQMPSDLVEAMTDMLDKDAEDMMRNLAENSEAIRSDHQGNGSGTRWFAA